MVTIPKEFREKLGFTIQDKVEVRYRAGTVIITPKKEKKKKYTVADWGKHAISVPNFDMKDLLKDLKGRRYEKR